MTRQPGKFMMCHGRVATLLLSAVLLLAIQAWAIEPPLQPRDFVRRPYPSAENPKYAANQVLVTLRPGYTEADLAALNAEYGSRVVHRLSNSNTYVLDLPGATGAPSETMVANQSAILKKHPAVASVQYNHAFRAAARPNDEYYQATYGMFGLLYGQWPLQPDPLDSTLQHIYAPEAWDLQKGSSDVIVAVIDTGIRTSGLLENGILIRRPHPDLVNRLITNPSYVFGQYGYVIPPDTAMWDFDPSPSETGVGSAAWMHGTAVAGLIAAETDNLYGIAGICWDGVRILPVKASSDTDAVFYADAVYEALEYVIRYRDSRVSSKTGEPLRVNVVNMSFGGNQPWPAILVTQVQRAVASGIVVVAAAGNDWEYGNFAPGYPAALEEVICVGSTNSRDLVSSFSQRGPTLDLVAPGEDVVSTAYNRDLAAFGENGDDGTTDPSDPGDDEEPPVNPPGGQSGGVGPLAISNTYPDQYGNYIAQFISGTSFAAPHVAAAAALLISHGVPASEVKDILCSTATPIGIGQPNDAYGWGLLNLRKALEKASIEVKVQTPAKSDTVTGPWPSFRIDFRHADKASIRVTIDGKPIIGGPRAAITDWEKYYYTLDAAAGKTYLQFDYPVPVGRHTITVSASSDIQFAPPGPTVIPSAQDTSTFAVRANVLRPGWHMFSVPYMLDRSIKPDTIIGSTATLWRYAYADGEVPNYAAYSTYSPTEGRKDNEASFHPDSAYGGLLVHPTISANATPPAGLGYWLRVRDVNGLALDLTNNKLTGAPINPASSYAIGLYKGWNMVGCPYLTPAGWQSAIFDFGGIRLTAQDAVLQGWIGNYVYTWDPAAGAYAMAPISTAFMQPWQAQWIKVKVGRPDDLVPGTPDDPLPRPRLENRLFIDGFEPISGVPNCTGAVARNWDAYSDTGGGVFTAQAPGVTGSAAQGVRPSGSGGFIGGIKQINIPAVVGERYTFSVWTRRARAGGSTWVGQGTRVGIDPDPSKDAVPVVWSSPLTSIGQWTQQVVYAQAQNPVITVYVEVDAFGSDHLVYIDDAKLIGGHDVTLIVNPG